MQNIGCFANLEGPQIRVWLFPGCSVALPGVAWRLVLIESLGASASRVPVAQPCCLSGFSFFLKGEASSSPPRIQRHACAWPRLHSEAGRPKAAHGGSETGLLHVSASGLVSLPWTRLSCLCLPLVTRTQDGTSQRHPGAVHPKSDTEEASNVWPTVAVTCLHWCILPLSWTSAGRS